MRDLGWQVPGTTVYLYWDTFDAGTGASLTMTGLALGDIIVFKDGSVAQRASTAGFTLLDTDGIDFDARTGLHGVSINLANNTTANFYEAGSHYAVAIDSVTIDGQTVRFWLAEFRIGYQAAILNTTIATLSTQTSFTLEDGSADNDAYNGCVAVIHDLSSGVQIAIGYVLDYVGSTKTVTLSADPGIFTIAANDHISFFPPAQVGSWNNVPLGTTNPLPNAAADAAGGLPISDAGGLDLDGRLDVAVSSRLAAASAPANWSSMGIETDGHVHGDVKQWLGVAPLALSSQRVQSLTLNDASLDAAVSSRLAASAAPTNFGDLAITATTGRVDVGEWLGVAVNALVSGRVDVSVGALAAGVITSSAFGVGAIDASAIGTDAIGSAELAASAAQKVRDEILPTQNAAFNFKFQFVAASDHVTPVTGATGISATRSIDGASYGAAGGTVTEIGNGTYRFAAVAGDMNGGEITFRFVATGGTPGAPDDAFVHVITGAGV